MVSTWAKGKPLVKRVYLFGSRVRGDHGAKSDIDIAVELDPSAFQGSDESGGLATWMFETKGWRGELQGFILPENSARALPSRADADNPRGPCAIQSARL